MKNNILEKQHKNEVRLQEIQNVKEEDIAKMSYKERQAYFRDLNKIVTIKHVSKNKDGKGHTYKKN